VLIHVKLTEALPDGKQRVLCDPCLVTLLGRPASFHAGAEIAPPWSAEAPELIPYGTRVQFRVLRKAGRLFLDATLSLDVLNRANADSVRVTTTSLRIAEAITPGKAIVVPVSDRKNERWELLVKEIQPKDTVPNGQRDAAAADCPR
jgi:hypothetical protein